MATNFFLNGEQAQTGIVAGMWTQEDINRAKKTDGHIKNNWYLIIKPITNETKKE
jgi:hypothetical protein